MFDHRKRFLSRFLALLAIIAALGACDGGRIPLDAEGRSADSAGSVESRALPLLDEGHRGSHNWARFCADQPDSAALPPDARTLVTEDVSIGRAVHFNVPWETCREAVDPDYLPPQNCGEYRDWVSRGATLVEGMGEVGAGAIVGGSYGDTAAAVSADDYNNLWRLWGLPGRPDDFDQLVAERWGFALPEKRNPYPLPGEDPNTTDGGSGQLPMGLTQLRTSEGEWTGRMGVTCHICHSSNIGTPEDGVDMGTVYGTAGQADIGAFLSDFGNGIGKLLPITVNRIRGTGNVTNYQLLVMLWLIGDEPARSGITLGSFVFAPATATEDSPVWWNVGHRPAKFYSAAMPSDATRIAMQAYMPLMRQSDFYNWENIQDWTDSHDRLAEQWLASLQAPRWPEKALGDIDTNLAEAGAILFHNKDLWADALNNPVPRPSEGNGSCASCHGAYAPRYTHDTAFLASPELAGQAAYRVPIEIIGTDEAYINSTNQGVTDYFKYSWLFYPPAPGEEGACYGSDDANDYRGYLAPPLYGVWASGPYFHNGSVPNIWGVLKSEDRPAIWRRVSRPNDFGNDRLVMGFDDNLQRAYDPYALGWDYDELECGSGLGTLPILDCNPVSDTDATILQQIQSFLYGTIGLTWNLDLPVMTGRQLESRKVYNTAEYSQSNAGHNFTDVLTDAERRALIEYLKTL